MQPSPRRERARNFQKWSPNQTLVLVLSVGGIAYSVAPPVGKKIILGAGTLGAVSIGLMMGSLYNWGRR